ncbi:MAG: hypothetical protein ACE5IM_05390 [Nitrospinota bacterium]
MAFCATPINEDSPLNHVFERVMHDPEFRKRFIEDRDEAVAGFGLTAGEREALDSLKPSNIVAHGAHPMLVVMALWRLELDGLLPSYTPYGVPKSTDPDDPEYTYY